MQVAITGCGTLERGTIITREKFFLIYPELQPFESQITLLPEAPIQSSQKCNTNQVLKHNIYTKNFIVIQN